MSLQAFDAQLLVPDNNASHLQLVHLIAAGQFTGTGLPDVAHRYLDAFCNKSYSNGRRRWAGIALGSMMRASTSVIQRLKKLSQGTPRLGAIILDREENEERRIIAGLIIRQGLEAGIDFAAFWESDKVMNSAPNFPRDASEQWMGQFQNYLDSLGELLLTNLNDDPVIMFPISLFARDGFQWTGSSAVAITENDLLTIITLNPTLTEVQFIDIPIRHIRNTSLQQDSPHESQEGRSGHKMYNVTMTLEAEASTYRLDSADRTAFEFKVSFLSHEDADEFEVGLQDAHKNLGRVTAARVEAVGSTACSNSSDNLRKPTAKPDNTTLPPRRKDNTLNGAGAGSGSTDMAEELVPSDQPGVQHDSAQPAAQDKGKGKLPRISNATKQKAVRTKQLPSSSRSKITKNRASAKPNPPASRSEDKSGDKDEESSQDEYSLKSVKAMHSSLGVGNGRKSQGRRKANIEDDDFVPGISKAKSKPTKRKRSSSDATDDSRPKRKTQTKSSDDPQLAAVSTARRPRAKAQDEVQTTSSRTREPMQQSVTQQNVQNETSSRPSLIGNLLKSKSPNKAAAPTFKKPGQPASTPGRPRAPHIQASPRPQTPIETCTDLDNLPVYISSSTPRSQAIHDEDFGLHYTPANTEILSSNTKRVPDSPHAESTAISGHADRDDVHREKWQGDMETAKSDPFKQRRQSSKMTSFIRRLTEERIAEDMPTSAHGEPFSMTFEANDDTEIDELTSNSACKPFPKHSPSLFKYHANTHHQSRTQQPSARIAELKILPTTAKESDKAAVATSHEAAKQDNLHGMIEPPRSTIRAREEPAFLETSKCAHVPAVKYDCCTTDNAAKYRMQKNAFVASASRHANEDGLPEISAQNKNHDNLDGDTTLIGEADLPGQAGAQASDLYFRSSPPIPDSSSVRGASTDESEADPELSPPTSRADELEWEAALQPHQRAIHEQLLRTSRRVMRHIVNNETAVTDVTDVFAEDGERLLGLLLERQSDEFTKVFQELAGKRQELLKEFSDASKSLKAQRKQVKSVD